jgi:tyrosyl-tRNA synthetase
MRARATVPARGCRPGGSSLESAARDRRFSAVDRGHTMMTPEQQDERLRRDAEEVLPDGALLERLRARTRAGRPLRVKQGFDPTAPDIHLGHAVGLRKLREFQDLGHQVVLIVGDYTGMVGDPSGRTKTRPQLGPEEIEANARTYLEQFYRVLVRDPESPRLPVEVHRNGEWFSRMRFVDVIGLAATTTVARLLERDDFAKRYAAQHPIGVHELLYPLMQGYDSVAIEADVELGGTDQKFNLLVGRALQELRGQAPQIIMTMPILPGLDGVQRMSKTLGNYVGVSEAPAEMFGKLMSIPDAAMPTYLRLAAGMETAGADAVVVGIERGTIHPMTAKKDLARRIVATYHGAAAAQQAQNDFEAQFSRREAPESVPVWVAGGREEMGIKDLLVRSGLAASGSAAWRAVDQGAVSVDGTRITDRNHRQNMLQPFTLRLGRRMVRVEPPPA